MKYDPSVLEIPVPKYFKEDDRLNVEIVFKEKVERGKGRKNAKPKRKKRKGKKAGKKGKNEETKEELITPDMKELWIDKEMEKSYNTTEATVEVVKDPFTAEM